jgi:hypothetical protein
LEKLILLPKGNEFGLEQNIIRTKMVTLYIAEIIYYWTSGAAITDSSSEEDNILWCSTNKTNEVPAKFAKSKRSKGHKCVAFERWTSRYTIVNCAKKMSFICEVISSIFGKVNQIIHPCEVSLPRRFLPSKRKMQGVNTKKNINKDLISKPIH